MHHLKAMEEKALGSPAPAIKLFDLEIIPVTSVQKSLAGSNDMTLLNIKKTQDGV